MDEELLKRAEMAEIQRRVDAALAARELEQSKYPWRRVKKEDIIKLRHPSEIVGSHPLYPFTLEQRGSTSTPSSGGDGNDNNSSDDAPMNMKPSPTLQVSLDRLSKSKSVTCQGLPYDMMPQMIKDAALRMAEIYFVTRTVPDAMKKKMEVHERTISLQHPGYRDRSRRRAR